jgi:hypothetical protein
VPAIAERHKRTAERHAVHSASHLYQAARPKTRRRLRPLVSTILPSTESDARSPIACLASTNGKVVGIRGP